MSFVAKFWGVRGSLPSAPPPEKRIAELRGLMKSFFQAGFQRLEEIDEFLGTLSVPQVGGFGTATTCVEVSTSKPGERLIIDAGSGIRGLSDIVMKDGGAPIAILMTHFHWDHLLGLPFFTPIFMKSRELHFYGVQEDLEERIRGIFRKPYFPVPFEALPSKIIFHVMQPRVARTINGFEVTPYQLDHPDPCWGYRIVKDGLVYSHCVDTESTRVSRKDLGPDLPLYQGVDLMFFDAQYTLPELSEKANWGHSAAQIGLDIAFREGVKNIVFAHHDPGAANDDIEMIKRQTREYYDWRLKTALAEQVKLPNVKWRFAYEQLEMNMAEVAAQSSR